MKNKPKYKSILISVLVALVWFVIGTITISVLQPGPSLMHDVDMGVCVLSSIATGLCTHIFYKIENGN